MSALPAALRPWGAQLALFPEELALSLGAHVARLAAALGPMRPWGEREGGELQGYDGLARRGSPERLLVSEWLLAMEAPDEFVRRAASGEQSFLRPAFRQPRGGRRLVALLDAGPDQLGAPRLAHLALLVVLARRAEAAQAAFVWGVLQEPPEKGPSSALSPALVERWLKASSVEPPTGARLSAWREALQLGRAAEDAWLVGAARLARLPEAEGLSRVQVEEVVAPGARRLTVEVRPTARPVRTVLLELPPAPDCVRLLRDPFRTLPTAPFAGTQGRVRGLRFSADGARLLLVYEDGSFSAQALPHSPRATLPRPKRFLLPGRESLVAVGWRYRGGLLAVTQEGNTLRVHGPLKGHRPGRSVSFPVPEGVAPPRPPRIGEPPLLAVSQVKEGTELVFVLDAAGVLHRLGLGEGGPTVTLVAQDVTALIEVQGTLLYVVRRAPESLAGDGLHLMGRTTSGSWMHPLGLDGDGQAYLGFGRGSSPREGRPLAVRHRPGRWRLLSLGKSLEVSPPVGMRVVGLLPEDEAPPRLLVLGEDRRTFAGVGPEGTARTVLQASADVASVTMSAALPVLAWLAVNGEVWAWDFQRKAILFHSTPRGGP